MNGPPSNVWLGVSVEDQECAEERIPLLLETPASIRFLSCEPLLGGLDLDLHGIHWVIVGGESGHNARPMHPDWARSLRDQCVTSKVAFFFKQWGELIPVSQLIEPDKAMGKMQKEIEGEEMVRLGKKAAGRMLDGREWNEFPFAVPDPENGHASHA
jgi:protein gp37